MDAWDEQYAGQMGGKSLIETVTSESTFGVDIDKINYLKGTLVQRAKSLGLTKEANAFSAIVNDNNFAFFKHEDEINSAFKSMIESCKEAEEAKKKEKTEE